MPPEQLKTNFNENITTHEQGDIWSGEDRKLTLSQNFLLTGTSHLFAGNFILHYCDSFHCIFQHEWKEMTKDHTKSYYRYCSLWTDEQWTEMNQWQHHHHRSRCSCHCKLHSLDLCQYSQARQWQYWQDNNRRMYIIQKCRKKKNRRHNLVFVGS